MMSDAAMRTLPLKPSQQTEYVGQAKNPLAMVAENWWLFPKATLHPPSSSEQPLTPLA
jgi:hypothetical protein